MTRTRGIGHHAEVDVCRFNNIEFVDRVTWRMKIRNEIQGIPFASVFKELNLLMCLNSEGETCHYQ